jgi:hypothetical protein
METLVGSAGNKKTVLKTGICLFIVAAAASSFPCAF